MGVLGAIAWCFSDLSVAVPARARMIHEAARCYRLHSGFCLIEGGREVRGASGQCSPRHTSGGSCELLVLRVGVLLGSLSLVVRVTSNASIEYLSRVRLDGDAAAPTRLVTRNSF